MVRNVHPDPDLPRWPDGSPPEPPAPPEAPEAEAAPPVDLPEWPDVAPPEPPQPTEPPGEGLSREDLRRQLEEAVRGLLYMSESDYPFDVIEIPSGTAQTLEPEQLLAALHLDPGTPVEERQPDFFKFGVYDELDESEPPQRADELLALLQRHLEGLRGYRIGEVEVGIYVLGIWPAGGIVGLRSLSVET